MVSVRQVYRILRRHGETHGVVTSHEVETRGRSRKLLLADLQARGYMHIIRVALTCICIVVHPGPRSQRM